MNEDNQELFYHYYFQDIEKPINILATNKKEAREILERSPLPAEYAGKDIIQETNSHPLPGVSKMSANGKHYLWVGKDKSKNGWKEITDAS